MKSIESGIHTARPELLLDAQELVILGDALRAAGRSGLDLTGIERNRQIRNGGVLRFSGTMGRDGGIPGAV